MAKDAYYFSHDSNARNDPKIKALRKKYGLAGYAKYFIIIEMLRESDNYELPCKDYIFECIADEFNEQSTNVQQTFNDLVNVFELIQTDGQKFWSEALKNRMSFKDHIREQAKKAGKASAEKRRNINDVSIEIQRTVNERSTDVQQTFNECSTKKERKKERKKEVKEEKEEKENGNNITADNFVFEEPKDKEYVKFFLNEIDPMASSYLIEKLTAYETDGFEPSAIKLAIEKALENNVRSYNYISKILVSWRNEGLFTKESILAAEKIRQANIKTSRQKAEEPEDYYKNVPRI